MPVISLSSSLSLFAHRLLVQFPFISIIVMSATEAAATPAVAVEEAKPEAPVTDTSAPAPEAPKVETAEVPVRLFLCVIFHRSLFFFFLLFIRRLRRLKRFR